MATVKSNFITRLDSTPQLKADYGHGGTVRVYAETYTAAALATNSTIKMVRVRACDRVLSSMSWIRYAALGAGTAITVGDQYDTDRFCTSLSTVAANCHQFNVLINPHYTYSCDQDILISTGNGSYTGDIQIELAVVNAG